LAVNSAGDWLGETNGWNERSRSNAGAAMGSDISIHSSHACGARGGSRDR
jgi:hypothetical protein